MQSLYIHIPFCRSRCIYCDFFSTTLLPLRQQYVDALCLELNARGDEVSTVYIGGGTPSQLDLGQIRQLLHAVHIYNKVDAGAELTFECNPDDISAELLECLLNMGVNRLSMGVQTFDDDMLHRLRRRHTSAQARAAVEMAQKAGFRNISIDLMFGFPQFVDQPSAPASALVRQFADDLDTALSLGIQHLSAYSLMYEDGTTLSNMLAEGSLRTIDDETARLMYELLLDRTSAAGMEHYEISNFAMPGYRSRHNSSYWNDTPYIGIGAAAHGYDGHRRNYHTHDIRAYIAAPLQLEVETLTADEHYNDYVMTRLRTCEGVHLPTLRQRFGQHYYSYFMNLVSQPLDRRLLVHSSDDYVRLTREGLFVSDDIMSDLMAV